MPLQMHPTLLMPPVEVLELVADHLSVHDLAALRSTCRALCSGLFHQLVRRCFRSKRFILTPESLSALDEIARHDTLGPQLRHLGLGMDFFSHEAYDEARQHGATHMRSYMQHHKDQTRRRGNNEDVRRLDRALRGFGSLDTLTIGAAVTPERTFPIDTWDGWRDPAWGIERLTMLTAVGLDGLRDKFEYDRDAYMDEVTAACEHTLDVTLAALASSGCKVRCLQVNLLTRDAQDHAWRYVNLDPYIDALKPCLRQLKELYWCPPFYAYPTPEDGSVSTSDHLVLTRLLGMMPELERLTLVLIQVLSSPRRSLGSFDELSRTVSFPSLDYLSLESAEINSDRTVRFFEEHGRTLQTLRLLNVKFVSEELAISVLEAVRKFPHLEKLELSELRFHHRQKPDTCLPLRSLPIWQQNWFIDIWCTMNDRPLLGDGRESVLFEGAQIDDGIRQIVSFWRTSVRDLRS